MCGRGACTLSGERCRRIAGGARPRNLNRLRPRYNLGPQGYVPVVRGAAPASGGQSTDGGKQSMAGKPGSREVCAMKWGLVPAFAKRPEDYDVFKGGSSTFNARVESLDSSGMWRRLLETHRGVVLFDGFYEWKTTGKTKVPMFIRNCDDYAGHEIPWPIGGQAEAMEEGFEKHTQEPSLPQQEASQADVASQGAAHAPLMFAALYDTWKPKDGAPGDLAGDGYLETVTIVTMESEGTPVANIHNRMPVFLTPDTAATWLDPSVSFSKAIGPIVRTSQEHAKQQLHIYEVSSLVSNVKNESPDCVLPKKEVEATQFSKGLGKFFTKKDPSAAKSVETQESPPTKRRAGEQSGGAAAPPEKAARQEQNVVIVLD